MVPPRGVVDVLRGEDALDDELVGAPVPHAEDGHPEDDPGPGEVGVGGRLPHVHEGASDGGPHLTPAPELLQAEEGDAQGAGDDHEDLHEVGVEDRPQPAEDGVQAGGLHHHQGPAVQKSMPMIVSKTMPPAAMVTEILVSTYPTIDTTARYQRAAGEHRRSRNSGIVNTPLCRPCLWIQRVTIFFYGESND
jgi:hypothetical protein